MMSKIVNLRLARKRKGRAAKKAKAAENAALHGRSAGERERMERDNESRERRLDAHLRTPEPPEET